MTDLARIHPDGYQKGNGEEHTGSSEPTFHAAYFAGANGGP